MVVVEIRKDTMKNIIGKEITNLEEILFSMGMEFVSENKDSIKFSIIVPTYMEKDYIGKCLETILKLDYPREGFEIIVSDANSTDGTIDIAKKYADQVVVTKKRGISVGRNEGAKKANGEILLFIDADVEIEPNFLKILEQDFNDSNTVCVTGRAIPSDGSMLIRGVYHGTYAMVKIFEALGKPLYPGMCVAYRKIPFFKLNGFREDYGIVEDLDMSNRASTLGKCKSNYKARAFASTRRLQKNGISMVTFHIFNDIRYLLGREPAKYYPKEEELQSWKDIWKVNRTK